MQRRVFADHYRRTRLPAGRRAKARSDARRIAGLLRQHGASRVVGIGSAFVPDRRFTWRSDIDLAVAGLPAERFFSVSAQAEELTDFNLDIIPIESATATMLRTIREDGVDLGSGLGTADLT